MREGTHHCYLLM